MKNGLLFWHVWSPPHDSLHCPHGKAKGSYSSFCICQTSWVPGNDIKAMYWLLLHGESVTSPSDFRWHKYLTVEKDMKILDTPMHLNLFKEQTQMYPVSPCHIHLNQIWWMLIIEPAAAAAKKKNLARSEVDCLFMGVRVHGLNICL